MELKVAIIADDLTGANDSSVQFASRGMSTAVAVPGVEFDNISPCEVLVVDTESRDIYPNKAFNNVYKAAKELFKLNPNIIFYKKVDSTLRGNIGSELDALFQAYRPKFIIFAPAFIESGRTTLNGIQFLHGKKLEDTELANVPKSPVDCSYIPEIIARQSNLKTAVLEHEIIKQGFDAIVDALKNFALKSIDVIICDALKVSDLDLIAKASKQFNKVAFAGSAGLAKALSKLLPEGHFENITPKAQKVLILAGSISEVTRAQTKSVYNQRSLSFIKADPVLSIQEPLKAAEITAQKVKQALSQQNIVLVSGAPEEEDVKISAKAGADIGLNYFQTGERMATFMAELMRLCADEFDGFVLTGGDTAIHACQACGANLLKIISEVQSGIPLACIASGAHKGKFLITKAGAFGNIDAFVEATDILTCKGKSHMKLPALGLTMGDPAGIGSEIIVKALLDPQIYSKARPIVFGDAYQLERLAKILKADVEIHVINDIEDAQPSAKRIEVIDLHNVPHDIPFGQISPICGNAAYEYIEAAIKAHIAHKIQAIVTAPLNKEALHAGGHNFPGHTEILATLTGTKDYSMMLVSPKLRVIHVSTHVSLRGACDACKQDRVYRVIKLAYETMKLMGFASPRIAVAGLNPHCGEHGLFGNEDIEQIVPAVEQAKAEGINVQGPIAPDTVFHRAANRNEFDIVVVQYHDQGHIPLKVLGFSSGVNVTVGLPIIRTSVDHGTAFEIAGKGIADPESMSVAMDIGAQMGSVKFADELI